MTASTGRQFSVTSGLETESMPFSTVPSAFFAQAEVLRSSKIAARDQSSNGKSREMTYQELAARAQALSLHLLTEGVGQGHRIPLVAGRRLESVVGILAILSCGAQFVPVDNEYHSDEYLRSAVAWSGQGVVLSTSLDADEFISRAFSNHTATSDLVIIKVHSEPAWTLNLKYDLQFRGRAVADDVCYTVFKSGIHPRGSATAKEVRVRHESVVNLTSFPPGNLGIGPGVNVGQIASIASDIAVWEIFGCLCNGGTLVIGGGQPHTALRKVHILITTPTLLSRYEPNLLPQLRILAVVGEPISNYVADQWAAHVWAFWNCYGSSETTIVSFMSCHRTGFDANHAPRLGSLCSACPTPVERGGMASPAWNSNDSSATSIIASTARHHVCSDLSHAHWRLGKFCSACPTLTKRDGVAAIGHPIPNSFAYVLDVKGHQRPIGLPGAIWVGGRGVSDDYMGYGPESYIVNPFREDKSYLYRTGDYGFCNEDGSIEIISPVSVQDYATSGLDLSRVELQKLESAWACAAGTQSVAVLAFRLQVHCFFVGQGLEDENEEDLRLATSMDDHVNILQQNGDIPRTSYVDQYHRLPELPVGVDGKLDRAKLRAKVLCQRLQIPPGILGPVTEILPPQAMPISALDKERLSPTRSGMHTSSVSNLLATPLKILRIFKGSVQ